MYALEGDYEALTPTHRYLPRAIAALSATAVLPILFGCQGHRIVARLNGEAINDDQYLDRIERVVPAEFEQMSQAHPELPIDAGAVALVTALREKAVDVVAKNKNVVPMPDTVDSIYRYDLLLDAGIEALILKHSVAPEEIKKNIRLSLEALGIGTDGAKVDAKELDDAFKSAKTSPVPTDKLDIPERYGLKLLGVKNTVEGQLVLGRLKATGDFKTEALQESDKAPFDGTERIFPADQIQRQLPVLYDALKPLTPGQFAPSPVTLTAQTPTGPQTFYAVVQLTRKMPSRVVTLNEVSAELTQRLLKRKFPQWQQHFVQSLNDFLVAKDTVVEVDIERYKTLVPAFLQTPAQLPSQQGGQVTTPGGMPSGSGAPPAAGSATSSPSTGKP